MQDDWYDPFFKDAEAKIAVLPTATKENVDASVYVLEKMLELVRSGEIAAVICAYVRKDRVSVSYSWSSSDAVPALIGAIELAKQDMAAGSIRERQK